MQPFSIFDLKIQSNNIRNLDYYIYITINFDIKEFETSEKTTASEQIEE